MRQSVVVAGIVFAAVLGSAVSAGKLDSAVTIVNESAWDIHHLFLSSVDEEEWGPDQLGDHVIGNGGKFTLTSIPCDEYDVKLVDEDGDECVIGAVDVCGDSDDWVITDDDLLECEGYGEEGE